MNQLDEAELTKAILANPQDMQPRQRYADRLTESPWEADRARAKFIRAQIALEQVQDHHPDAADLIRQERQLREQFQAIWEKPHRESIEQAQGIIARVKGKLFGPQSAWAFRRGFVEAVQATARHFLSHDIHLLQRCPIQAVSLSHANTEFSEIVGDKRLTTIPILRLTTDLEMDEDLHLLTEQAKEVGFTVHKFGWPRIITDADELFSLIRHPNVEEKRYERDQFLAWARASSESRERIERVAKTPLWRSYFTETAPGHSMMSLLLEEWIHLGDRAQDPEIFAIVRSYHDLPDENGLVKRLILTKGPGPSWLPGHAYQIQ